MSGVIKVWLPTYKEYGVRCSNGGYFYLKPTDMEKDDV